VTGSLASLFASLLLAMPALAEWTFTDVTTAAGITAEHGYVASRPEQYAEVAGGVAAGDYDGDGFVDLYVVGGDAHPNRLFHNVGDGTFEERGSAAGVRLEGRQGSGPTFADLDGDGRLDLLVLDVGGAGPTLFRNRGDGTFEDVTAASGLASTMRGISAAAGDYDGDGDLDLFLTHWSTPVDAASREYLWRNDGAGHFDDVTTAAGLPVLGRSLDVGLPVADFSFAPTFVDLDDDGALDLLVTSDFETSRVLLGTGAGTFIDVTGPEITDENGMGSAVADFDGDGILDWFVSSVWDPDQVAEGRWGVTGNRLYRGLGGGAFADVTDAAGVRNGGWGWGSSAGDFDLDGRLDIVHVNGWRAEASDEFLADVTRLFLQSAGGAFVEQGAARGLGSSQGRGVVVFDYDRDGDLDLYVANNGEMGRLYRNDGLPARGWLTVRLDGAGPNPFGVGARIFAHAGSRTQRRDLFAGSSYVSQNPLEAHFGFGKATVADEVRVEWPGGAVTTLADVALGRCVSIVADGAVGDCARPTPGTCADVPRAVERREAKACRLLGKAVETTKPQRRAKLCRRARTQWTRADRKTVRLMDRGRLDPTCAGALVDRFDEARRRIDEAGAS